jgi:hypothetical protein
VPNHPHLVKSEYCLSAPSPMNATSGPQRRA